MARTKYSPRKTARHPIEFDHHGGQAYYASSVSDDGHDAPAPDAAPERRPRKNARVGGPQPVSGPPGPSQGRHWGKKDKPVYDSSEHDAIERKALKSFYACPGCLKPLCLPYILVECGHSVCENCVCCIFDNDGFCPVNRCSHPEITSLPVANETLKTIVSALECHSPLASFAWDMDAVQEAYDNCMAIRLKVAKIQAGVDPLEEEDDDLYA
ncbi:hypothetical protein AURDEDRAFT_177094 [Auricularia subglabra TFB-10046 SS5]|uniref:RING-type domain-containing protein n=1 Tax=Auricularia subglabra (strain TFB-10046 / SS5) TaxID=717982 RepID=J0D504_AURST|nr:hypothetical protein AURDEDRAFT_177094 [Auricularia subglabra TFB-10046 SS5]